MSIVQRRQKLQQLLTLLKRRQLFTAADAAKRLNCHISTIEKLLRLLRKNGHVITYNKSSKRYHLEDE